MTRTDNMGTGIETHADGRAAFMAARTPAYHRLGTVLEDAPNAEQALHAAMLDWTVTKQPLFAHVVTDDGVTPHEIGGKWATVRTNPTTGKPDVLGVVGDQYEVVQNVDAFRFLDTLVDGGGDTRYETAGSLRGGRTVFMTMTVPRDIVIGKGEADDRVTMHLFATNGHDGHRAFTCGATPIRIECANMLSWAIKGCADKWSVAHTRSIEGRVQEARETLNLTFAYADAFETLANDLYAKAISTKQVDSVLTRLFPLEKGASDRVKASVVERRDTVRDLYLNASTNTKITGTAWGLVNAITEWAEWVRPVRGADDETEAAKRAQTALTPQAAAFRQNALTMVSALS